jgi:catechol 2,3-dioxygenase-like lactoylglutathione lyase family enzyme
MRLQIDHVTIRVANRDTADAFYRATLRTLGFERGTDEHGRVSFGTDAGHQFGSIRMVRSSSSSRTSRSLRLRERQSIVSIVPL